MRRVFYMKGECMMMDEKESIAKLKDYATRILKLCEDYERTGKINRKLSRMQIRKFLTAKKKFWLCWNFCSGICCD